jgi:hypothetical protein
MPNGTYGGVGGRGRDAPSYPISASAAPSLPISEQTPGGSVVPRGSSINNMRGKYADARRLGRG